MSLNGKAKITYPCNWTYKIIGLNKEPMIQAAASILNTHPYSIEESNTSKSGKYISLEINLTVKSEEERNSIYKTLKDHESIKMVI